MALASCNTKHNTHLHLISHKVKNCIVPQLPYASILHFHYQPITSSTWELCATGIRILTLSLTRQTRSRQLETIHHNIYIYTYIHIKLTLCSRLPYEQLWVAQQIKKFPAFSGMPRFMSIFTMECHRSYTELNQSSPKSPIHFNIILPCRSWSSLQVS